MIKNVSTGMKQQPASLKRHLNLLCYSLILCSLPCFSAYAKAPLIWTVANFAPHIYIDNQNQVLGPIGEIGTNILAHAGLDYKINHTSNKRAEQFINKEHAEFGMSSIYTLEKPEDFYISQYAVHKVQLRAYWFGEHEPVLQASDLRQQSLILIGGLKYAGLRDYIEDPSNQVTLAVDVENHQRALQALKLARATYMLGYHFPVVHAQRETKLKDLHSNVITELGIHFYIKKTSANSQKTMQDLEAAYQLLYRSAAPVDIIH
jgi:hypothetical protein